MKTNILMKLASALTIMLGSVAFATDSPTLVCGLTGKESKECCCEQKEGKPNGKQIIWFENSGHWPHFEESQEYRDALINSVLRSTYRPARDMADARRELHSS